MGKYDDTGTKIGTPVVATMRFPDEAWQRSEYFHYSFKNNNPYLYFINCFKQYLLSEGGDNVA